MVRVSEVLEIPVYCVCGEPLVQLVSEQYHPKDSVTVQPCPVCIKQAKEEKGNVKTA